MVDVLDGNGVVIRQDVYQINPKHRDGSPNKSQWTIRNQDEAGVFGWALEHGSKSGKYYWGVFLDGLNSCVLGQTTSHRDTRIARFESSAQPIIWHGYPVDYFTAPQRDCPDKDVLSDWEAQKIITKSQISKLIRGMGWKD